MSPNTVPDAQSHPLTVAQRKEAHELRKTLKPLMEKRRRARINDSLHHLKTLILPLVGKDAPRSSRLEKADILEMTVRFLGDLPSSSARGQTDSFQEGYNACVQRVSALLPQSSLDADTRRRVHAFLQHSTGSAQAACLGCCAHGCGRMSRVQQRLVSRRSSSSAESLSISSRPQPAPPAAVAVWRPW